MRQQQPDTTSSKPPPFSDEQIRVKAYEIWKVRGGERGLPEEDWQEAITALEFEHSLIGRLSQGTRSIVQGIWNWTGFNEKKGWDFLQLLIVPIVLASLGLGLQEFSKQRERAQQEADKQREQQIEDSKARQEILAKYLDQMAELLEKGLLTSELNSEISLIAQAKTVITLQSLAPEGQHLVIQFLEATNLNRMKEGNGLLFRARMSKAQLAQADFSGANLTGIYLIYANLVDANFIDANLSQANLYNANLQNSKFYGANLTSANFTGADLTGANFADANLSKADLSGANLTRAYFGGVNFYEAKLRAANLDEADLNRAKLCKTVMPDGTLNNRDCKSLDI